MADLTDLDVREMKRFLDEICADLKRWLPEPRWSPAWQSEAARECENDESGPGGSWGELPVRAAYLAAALFLEAVLQCLRAMSTALTTQTTPYVLYCPDRAAMEAGGQALWLLEAGIGARRRVTRWILIRASGARNLAEAVSETDPESTGLYGETPDRVDDEAARLRLQLQYRSMGRYRGEWRCEEEKLPGYTARSKMLEAAIMTQAAYKIYSEQRTPNGMPSSATGARLSCPTEREPC